MRADSLGTVGSVVSAAIDDQCTERKAVRERGTRAVHNRGRAARTLYASVFVMVGFLLSINAQSAPDTVYEVTDLGTLGGTYSRAYGINNSGQVGRHKLRNVRDRPARCQT